MNARYRANKRLGKILHQLTAKDGRKVILRILEWKDVYDPVELSNSIADEDVDIATTQKITREEYADQFKRRLALMEKGEVLRLVAEVEGKVIAGSELRKRSGHSRHVGNIGVGIRRGYRDIGIGTEIMRTLTAHAKTMGLGLIDLAVASSSKRAIHVYEKVGFKETGRIPKFYYRDGKYFDEVIMAKEIE